jgi:hypothetical protein
MQRGRHTLHKNLIQGNLFPEEESGTPKHVERYERVKDKIACRYYYYAAICRMLYRDCLVQLEMEFDRSDRTIVNLLETRPAFIQKLVDNETTAAELKKRYPWYDWSYRPRN